MASSVYEGGSFELKAKLVDYWNRLIVDNRFSTLFDPQHDGVFSPATGVLDNTPVLGASQTYEPPIAEFAPYGQDNLGEYSALFTAVGSAGQSDNIAVSANLVTRQVNLNDVCLRVNQSITIPQPSLISGNVYLGAGSGAVCNGMGVPVQPGAGSVVEFSSLARTVTTTVNADGSYAFAEPQLLDQGADLRLVIADTSQYGCNCPGGCRYHLQVMTNGAAIVRDYYLMRPYWWQTRGGDVGANQAGGGVSVTSALPTGEALSLVSGVIMDSGILLNRSLADPSLGAGFFSEGYPSQLFNWVAHSAYETGPTNQRREDFELFRELLNIPVTPWVSDDFSGTGNKPLGVSATARIPGVFVYEGELIIGDWGGSDDVAANQAYIILVNGDVLIEAPRLTVAPRGFLMIIASGNIIISGEALMAQGIYVADESLNFEADPSLRPFNGEGVFVGWSGVSFGRSLTNNANPAELMTYRPDFLLYAPDDLRYPVFNWKQELPQKVDEAVFESWPGP